MQSLRSGGRHLATRASIIPLSPASPRVRITALFGMIFLLTGLPQIFAQGRTATVSLVLQVHAEEVLQNQNGSILLKIRLARGTSVRLWAADSCASPSPEAQIVTLSGIYNIPLNLMRPASSDPNSSASRVCLLSSDGMLRDSLSVAMLGPGNSMAEQVSPHLKTPAGAAVLAPVGWTMTTQAGTTTLANP